VGVVSAQHGWLVVRAPPQEMNAVIRDGFLYTCHHIGLSGTNGTYVGNEYGTNAGRSAVQWLKLKIETNSLSYDRHGRVFDPATSNTKYYHFPSIAVNCASDMLVGFSGSSSNTFISAYYAWKPANGTNTEAPVLIHAGVDSFENDRWGDYSASNVDPSDSTTFWTLQEYAEERIGSDPPDPAWGTWMGKIRKR